MNDLDGVIAPLAQALEKRGYSKLTPVQLEIINSDLGQSDALVSAQTGSGKTVAFGLALADTLLGENPRFGRISAPLALIIAPTRELAIQVKGELQWLYASTGATIASCGGGMDMRAERRVLAQGAHIVVGTPGRLRDHVERGSFDTSALKAIVLDEADEMLDMGFRDELEYILDSAPASRRTLMFSATISRSIANLAKRYQKDAKRISTKSDTEQHKDIEYRALMVAPNDRENAIINVLRFYDAKNALVFCGTRAMVNHLTSRFNNRGFSVVALSGELSQNERTHALQAMRDGRAKVCIATDVAARGIDLPDLQLVVHADIPKSREPLLHRSGRTGRAGRKGVSVLIVPHNWRKRVERLFDSAKIDANWAKPPSLEEVIARDRERFLTNPVFDEEINNEESEFVKELLSRHGVDKIAAAMVRLYHSSKPAAEELLDTAPMPDMKRRAKADSDFDDGVWVSLSIGRNQQAEPRWLIPLLCRSGNMTKREIGAIRIANDESFIELTANIIDGFMQLIGPNNMIEKTIKVTRLEGKPEFASLPRGKKTFFDKKQPARGDRERSRDRSRNRPRDKPTRDISSDRSRDKPNSKFRNKDNQRDDSRRDNDHNDHNDKSKNTPIVSREKDSYKAKDQFNKKPKVKEKDKSKAKKKKPHKKKLARAAARAKIIDESGMAPLKRK